MKPPAHVQLPTVANFGEFYVVDRLKYVVIDVKTRSVGNKNVSTWYIKFVKMPTKLYFINTKKSNRQHSWSLA